MKPPEIQGPKISSANSTRIEFLRAQVTQRQEIARVAANREKMLHILSQVPSLEFQGFSGEGTTEVRWAPPDFWPTFLRIDTWENPVVQRLARDSDSGAIEAWLTGICDRQLAGASQFFLSIGAVGLPEWARITALADSNWLCELWKAIPAEKDIILLEESRRVAVFLAEEENNFATVSLVLSELASTLSKCLTP